MRTTMSEVLKNTPSDLKTEEGVVAYMLAATSEGDWIRRRKEVNAANNGKVPEYFSRRLILSGELTKLEQTWKAPKQVSEKSEA